MLLLPMLPVPLLLLSAGAGGGDAGVSLAGCAVFFGACCTGSGFWPLRLRVWRKILKYQFFAAKPDFDALIFSDQLGDFTLIGSVAIRLLTPRHCNFRQQRNRQGPVGF